MNDLPEKLLEIIACPSCKGDLMQMEKGLLCQSCGLCYPVRDGIPILLIEESFDIEKDTQE